MPQTPPASSARIAELSERLKKEPGSRLFLELAREYHDAGRLEEAASVCAQGVARHPAYLSARVLLGRIYFGLGRDAEARAEMEGVLDKVPDNLMARRILAEVALRAGDRGGALERFRALLAFNPADREVSEAVSRLEAELAGEDAAPPAAAGPPDAAATAAPESSSAGAPATPAGAGAAASAAEAGEAPPGGEPSVLATPTLAEIFLEQGMTEKAIEVYRAILEGDPDNDEARARLSALVPAGAGAAPAGGGLEGLEEVRRRKVRALSNWLAAITGGVRVP